MGIKILILKWSSLLSKEEDDWSFITQMSQNQEH